MRPLVFTLTITAILLLLFGLPWYTVVMAGAHWPAAGVALGSIAFGGALAAFPVLMYLGHGRRGRDWAAVMGDSMLGVVWVLFAWSLVGTVLRLGLAVAG